MSTTNGPGSINDGFSFNNKFYQSGDFTQFAGGAQVTAENGYNYLDYTPVVPVTFLIPNVDVPSRTQFVVSNYKGVGQNVTVSGAQGAGFTFNGAPSATLSGTGAGAAYAKTVHLVSGLQYLVY